MHALHRCQRLHRIRSRHGSSLQCRAVVPRGQFRDRSGRALRRPSSVPEAVALQLPSLDASLLAAYSIVLDKKRALVEEAQKNLAPLCALLIGGGSLVLGSLFPSDASVHGPTGLLTSVLGWGYFLSWSLSFYPQIIQNHTSKSVQGLSLDYLLTSLLGFACYSTFATSLTFSPDLQLAFSASHPTAPAPIAPQDLLFVYHALALTTLALYQFRTYAPPSAFRLSSPTKALFGAMAATTAAFALHHQSLAADPPAQASAALGFLYLLSYVKLTMTITSYVPQVLLNWRRRSTAGWSMGTVYLDLAGGLLCNLQLLVECHAHGDWAVLSGNPVKTGLGAISILFDAIFLTQHFLLYRASWDPLHAPRTPASPAPATLHPSAGGALRAAAAGKRLLH